MKAQYGMRTPRQRMTRPPVNNPDKGLFTPLAAFTAVRLDKDQIIRFKTCYLITDYDKSKVIVNTLYSNNRKILGTFPKLQFPKSAGSRNERPHSLF